MESSQLRKALEDLPSHSLITEIPEVQNAIGHLLKSNQEMLEYDPNDPDLQQAIRENKDLIKRKENQVDITLQVIRERLGEAAWREMGSNVKEFREIHADALKEARSNAEEGVFL
ncbi:hypothetical protein A0J61_04414 [Choanephora cucurbitarum]|uniref:Uncharacterized protein n=1 Tax=Choanephora cucurbitarum TaxID=101091 RepID=A0A1C7NEK4_9FUNG|nr:hypothetical protein A0J61_04414 [Choanephora cucurbitarum]